MNKIEAALLDIGVPPSLLGFRYLCDAIEIVVADPSYKRNVTSKLYPEVGQRNGSTGWRVERAARHAIEVAFSRSDPETLAMYFGNFVNPEKGKPTVSEFIAKMALDFKDNESELNFQGGR